MPDYDFRSLSPIDFEVLARDLLNAELGLNLVSFGVGPDGGIDLRDAKRRTVVQCKHRPDATKSALVASARTEAIRWTTSDMRSYMFVVSAAVSPSAEVAIREALAPLPVAEDGVWHAGTLNAALGRNSRVERDHFKLWLSSAAALEQISNASQWQRSEELLLRAADRVKLYVHTPAYAQAQLRLETDHVVMLSGAPGVGKSTLAEMLLIGLWHDGWTVVNIASDVDEAWRKIRASEEKVVFFYDDFLGQTSVAELQKNEGSGIALLIDRIRKGKGNQLLVLTTREQVLAQARFGEDDRVRRLAEDHSKMLVELDAISRADRAKMLFNHVHFGFTVKATRADLSTDERYLDAIDHPGFNPRILESVALRQKHSTVNDFYSSLMQALDHPEDVWAGSFRALSNTAVSVLFQLAISPGAGVEIGELRRAAKPTDARDWTPALKVLEGTWIRLLSQNGSVTHAALFDPSRRDFLLDLLDDASYFDNVFDEISSLGQITFLWKLAGLLEDDFHVPLRAPNFKMAASAQRHAAEVDDVVVGLAHRHFAEAEKDELETREFNEGARKAAAEEKSGSHSMHAETYATRLSTLRELASICFSSPSPTPKSEQVLHTNLAFFDGKLSSIRSADASSAFELAALLADPAARSWSHAYAKTVADFAFDSIRDSQEIRAYSQIPDWFREGPYKQRGLQNLSIAFEAELDGIRQQDDPDLMSQWLDETVSLAEDFGVVLDVEGLREFISEMEPFERENAAYRAPTAARSAPPEDSDDHIRALFAKLDG